MRMKLRWHGLNASQNWRTSYHSVEKETKCGATSTAAKAGRRKNNVQTTP
jgi:hypothetical protein